MPRARKQKAKAPKKAKSAAAVTDGAGDKSAPAPPVVGGEAPRSYDHRHKELADARRTMEAFSLSHFDTALPLVDVGGSPRLLKTALDSGFDMSNVISLCPDLIPGDKERSNRVRRLGGTPLDIDLGSWLDATLTRQPQLMLTHSLYHLDRATMDKLALALAKGAKAYSIHHTFTKPFSSMKGAKAFVYTEKRSMFHWPYYLYMEVEGNNFVYDHPYPPLCLFGYQRVECGYIVATKVREIADLYCAVFRLEWMPRKISLTIPSGLSLEQRDYAMWETKGWLQYYHDRIANRQALTFRDARAVKTHAGSLVLEDDDLLAETYKMISRRGIPSEAFIRVSAIKAVEALYANLPPTVMMNTAERLVERVMTETRGVTVKTLHWLNYIYNSIPTINLSSTNWLEEPAVLTSVCFAENEPDRYVEVLERLGAERRAEDDACYGKNVTIIFGDTLPDMRPLMSYGGCSHNLEASLVYRVYRDVPKRTRYAPTLTLFRPVLSSGLMVAPLSGPEWIARFSGSKRAMYEHAAQKYPSYAEPTNKLYYDIMVKSNENVIPKEDSFNKPRTICFPTPNVRLCTGRWAHAASKTVAQYWNGERPAPGVGAWPKKSKIYPIYCPTRSVNDLNDIIATLPAKYAIWGDISAFDASVEQDDLRDQYESFFKPFMVHNHAEEGEKEVFADMCGAGELTKPVIFRLSDDREIEIEKPKLRSGDSITSITGTMKNIDISVHALRWSALDVVTTLAEVFTAWVFCFGDDLLILATHAVDTRVYEEKMREMGFEIEVEQVRIEYGCQTPPDFLKHILITSPLRLIPDPVNWLKKFNVLWAVDCDDPARLWRAKLTALSVAAPATPVVAELTTHLLALLGRASELEMDEYNCKYRHPDVHKVSDAAMEPYTQLQLEEFLSCYRIPMFVWADFQRAVPRIVAQGKFIHPIFTYLL